MPKTDLALWSATELLHGYATRTVSPGSAPQRPTALTKIQG